MGNSESHNSYNHSSSSHKRRNELSQSVVATPTYLRRNNCRPFSSGGIQQEPLITRGNFARSYCRRSLNDYNHQKKADMSRKIPGWRSSQKRQKGSAQWSAAAMAKEKKMSEERERLFSAVISGEEETVLRMITRGMVDVNASDENHLTALHYAAMYLRPSIITVLIENGADPNAYDMKGGFTPVHWIVINSNPSMSDVTRINECLEALVRGGCNINSKDFNQATPLHFAARKDDKMVVDTLMRLGANPNDVDVLGRTCASVAKSEATKILIIKLADLRARAIYHVLEIPPSV